MNRKIFTIVLLIVLSMILCQEVQRTEEKTEQTGEKNLRQLQLAQCILPYTDSCPCTANWECHSNFCPIDRCVGY